MANKPLILNDGIVLNNETMSNYDEGVFTGTFTGFVDATSANIYYVITGKQVTLRITAVSGTSNATTFTMTGLPASLYPSRNQDGIIPSYRDNGTFTAAGICRCTSAGVVEFYTQNLGAWTNSGTKSIAGSGFVFTYILN